jgi:hypothetical protein
VGIRSAETPEAGAAVAEPDDEPEVKPAANLTLTQRIYAENNSRVRARAPAVCVAGPTVLMLGRAPAGTQSNKAARTLAKALGHPAPTAPTVSSGSDSDNTVQGERDVHAYPLVREGAAAHVARRGHLLRMLAERNQRLSEHRSQLVSTYLALEETWQQRVHRLEVRQSPSIPGSGRTLRLTADGRGAGAAVSVTVAAVGQVVARARREPWRRRRRPGPLGLAAGGPAMWPSRRRRCSRSCVRSRNRSGASRVVPAPPLQNAHPPPTVHRDALDDPEMRYKRTLAVTTPMELDAGALKFKYINNNGTFPAPAHPRAAHAGRDPAGWRLCHQGMSSTRRRYMKTGGG